MNFLQNNFYRIEQPLNIPNEPSGLQDEASNGATAGIPELPKIDKKCGYKPMILIPNLDGEYQILNGNLKITLDPTLKQIGIWIPETVHYYTTYFFYITIDRSPDFLCSDDIIRSNEIFRTKLSNQPFCSIDLMIS